jgi:hypothetical protein
VPHSDHQHSDRNVPVADRVLEIVRAPEGEQGITSGALCAARNFSRSPRLPQGYSLLRAARQGAVHKSLGSARPLTRN